MNIKKIILWVLVGIVAIFGSLVLISYSYMSKAITLSQAQNYHQAIIALEKSIQISPFTSKYIMTNVGAKIDDSVPTSQDLKAAKEYVLFVADYIAKHKPSVNGLLILGDLYNKLSIIDDSYLEQSSQVLQQALKLAPENPQVWFSLGRISLMRGDYDNAQINFDKAVALDNSLAEAQVLGALTRIYNRNLDEAYALVEATLASDSSLIANSLYTNLIITASKSINRLDFAIKVLSAIVETYPTADMVRSQLAELYQITGQINKAREQATYILENSQNGQARLAAKDFLNSL